MGTLKISLKAARVNANLTQEAAAAKAGINKATIANYESGTTVPDWDTAERLSEIYGIPLDNIFFNRNSA